MIARISILLLLLIVLPSIYIDWHYLSHRLKDRPWLRILWWLPSLLMLAFTLKYTFTENFIPTSDTLFNIYLFLLGIITVPKAFFSLCSVIGLLCCRLTKKHINWGNPLGIILSLFAVYAFAMGTTKGPKQLETVRYDLYFSNLPKDFDGYKIVHFSDAHVGTLSIIGKETLQHVVNTINGEHADAIVFTGDLQNIEPSELYPCQEMLSSLHAKDGVFSVLGNHDYSRYVNADDLVKAANERELQDAERRLGWTLLMNEHASIVRNCNSLVIAGTENGGKHCDPQRADINKTMQGISDSAFVIMLQHNPAMWKTDLLPRCSPELTLSGHTHGGQISFFGKRLTQPFTDEDYGLYEDSGRYMYVTSGISGLLPLRYGIYPEIAVITLHCKKQS